MWLSKYPQMDKKSYMSFEDFKSKMIVEDTTIEVTDEEIIQDFIEIQEKLSKKRGDSYGNI